MLRIESDVCDADCEYVITTAIFFGYAGSIQTPQFKQADSMSVWHCQRAFIFSVVLHTCTSTILCGCGTTAQYDCSHLTTLMRTRNTIYTLWFCSYISRFMSSSENTGESGITI
uniref:Uncharacterized protein n=1 Tax=Arundo donax TaxID=35708 RepID=A0A0A8ZLB0_ARUDO